jgi:hypothetical protein
MLTADADSRLDFPSPTGSARLLRLARQLGIIGARNLPALPTDDPDDRADSQRQSVLLQIYRLLLGGNGLGAHTEAGELALTEDPQMRGQLLAEATQLLQPRLPAPAAAVRNKFVARRINDLLDLFPPADTPSRLIGCPDHEL